MNTKRNTNPNDYIDLRQLARALWHRAWAIALSMVLFSAAAFSYSVFMITPLYQASVMIYVNNSSFSVGSTSISLADLSAAQSLVDTYVICLKAWPFLDEVIETAGLDCDDTELSSMIAAGAVDSTEVFEITVTSDDPEEAELIANTIADILPDWIAEIIDGSSARIIAHARVPATKSSPNITNNTAKGLMVGIVFSCMIIILLYLLDETIRDDDYLLKNHSLPILASIPDLLSSSKSRGYYGYGAGKKRRDEEENLSDQDKMLGPHMNFAAQEAYKLLLSNLMFALPKEKQCRVVGITSAVQAEGKSTVAINLAYSLAKDGKRVLVIEADMRIPVLANRLGIRKKPGLSNLLAGLNDGTDVLQRTEMNRNFFVLSSGDVPPNPFELLGSTRMIKVVELMRGSFDFILLDLPPMNIVSDALRVAGCIDGMIVVVRQNYSSRRLLNDAVRQLKFGEIKVLGFAVTDVTTPSSSRRKYGKKYGYYRYGAHSYEKSAADNSSGVGQ